MKELYGGFKVWRDGHETNLFESKQPIQAESEASGDPQLDQIRSLETFFS